MEETSWILRALEGLLTLVTGLLAYFGLNLIRRMDKQEEDTEEMKESFNQRLSAMTTIQNQCELNHARLELEVEKNYVAKADYNETMKRLFEGLKDTKEELQTEIRGINSNILTLITTKQDKP